MKATTTKKPTKKATKQTTEFSKARKTATKSNQKPAKKVASSSKTKATNSGRKPTRKASVVKYWRKNPVAAEGSDAYNKTIAELYQDMAVYCDGICSLARRLNDRIESTDIEPTHHTYISKSAKSIIASCEQIVDYIGNLGDLS